MSKKGFEKPSGEDFVSMFKNKVKTKNQTENIVRLDLSELIPNKDNPRKSFGNIDDLAKSIKENGLIQPITVTKTGDKYTIIAGERRYKAFKLLSQSDDNFRKIPCIVNNNITNQKIAALIENLQREDLTTYEESYFVTKIREELNISQDEMGKKIGKSRDYISGLEQYYKAVDKLEYLCVDTQKYLDKISKTNIIYLSSKSDEAIIYGWDYLKRNNFDVNQKEFRDFLKNHSSIKHMSNQITKKQYKDLETTDETDTDIEKAIEELSSQEKEKEIQPARITKPEKEETKSINKTNSSKNDKPFVIEDNRDSIKITISDKSILTKKSDIIKKINDILNQSLIK